MPSTAHSGDDPLLLSASDQRWQLLFEQSPLSIQIFSPDRQTIRFNKAWQGLFGLTPEQGHTFNVLQDPDLILSGVIHAIRKAFKGGIVFVPPVQFPVRNDPTAFRWVGGTLYPVIQMASSRKWWSSTTT